MSSKIAEELLEAALQRIESRRKPIGSTYRLQLHSGFTFRDATAVIPYLSKLGITHVYASPYFKAKPGSTHGYDVTDHCRLNPELGTQADYDAMVAALKSHGMHHILDMVPNHVGIGNNDNVWWNDVLKNGLDSIYAHHFDINWTGSPSGDLKGRVLLPLLGDLYAKELEAGKLKLIFETGHFLITYGDRQFPVSPRTYPMIATLPESDSLGAALTSSHPTIERAIREINGTPDNARSFDRLDALLRQQCYKLAHWRTAPDEINYRRFFDINDLAGLAMERPEVFEATHKLVLNLLAEDKISGLRIDHPDGLRDPKQYFERLQASYILAVAELIAAERGLDFANLRSEISDQIARNIRPLYVSVEKILALDEPLIESWPVSGTTGYEFLNFVNGLFVDSTAADAFTSLYRDFSGEDTACIDLIYRKKKLILEISLASELNVLTTTVKRISERDRYGLDFSLSALRDALKEIIACFAVYRSYITASEITDTDRNQIREAIGAATKRNPKSPREVFDFIERVLIDETSTNEELQARRNFAAKFQQLTAPDTAKGIEDTTFYIYNRLLSLNEVGGDPSHFGVTPDALHAFFLDRQRKWPKALSALSTHDTKRSEDVRARLNVLSENPEEWQANLKRWQQLNEPFVTQNAPDRNEQYAIYQTLLGAWPFDSDVDAFENRVQACVLKSMREAKVHTRWTDPNPEREKVVADFIHAILTSVDSQPFREDFRLFQRKLSRIGVVNSLSQTLLKLTAPGVPDTYQGTELWDLSLVDPDNRRPVDYAKRQQSLENRPTMKSMLETFEDGRVKLSVTQTALTLRKSHADLFERGQYIPLPTTGANAKNIFAFARKLDNQVVIAAVPRLVAGLMGRDLNWPIGQLWKDTRVTAPNDLKDRKLRNYFTNQTSSDLSATTLFAKFPLALLITE